MRDGYANGNLRQVRARLSHLLVTGGIGLVCASPGSGKTFAVRTWADGPSRNTHKVAYVCLSTLSTVQFYRQLCHGLGVEPASGKAKMFRDVQGRIRQLVDESHMRVIVVVDEAQFLSNDVLRDFIMLMNFDMDSRDYFSLVLVGQAGVVTALNRASNEALRQRVAANYTFEALTQDEAIGYLREMLRAAGGDPDLFERTAAVAAFASCGGSLRRLAQIATNALIVGARQQARTIDEEMVLAAVEETML